MENIIPPKNPKHKIFADAYLKGGSATQAAIDAGYSVRTAGVQSAGIIKRPDVASYIAAQQAKTTEQTGISSVKWQEELGRSAFSNIGDFITTSNDGQPSIDFSNATREQLSAVQSIKIRKREIRNSKGDVVGTEQQSELRLWDKLRALELLGRHAGYLKDTESRVVIDVADRLLSARGRVIQSNGVTGYLESTDGILIDGNGSDSSGS